MMWCRSQRIDRWLPFTLLTFIGLAMLWWSWGKWPDVLVDFGRELYVPWQLALGKRLYIDIAYFNGPLSPYLNSLWFRLFGASLLTLTLCNLVILTVLLWVMYHLFSHLSDRWSATIACLVLITMFAFARLNPYGNYNYVCPYSHEATHGLTLSMMAFYSLLRYHQTRRLLCIGLTGLLIGLVCLTKVEMACSSLIAIAIGFGLTVWNEQTTWHRKLKALAVFVLFAAVPSAVAFWLLGTIMPAAQALHATTLGWAGVHFEMMALPFYRWELGILDLGLSLRLMLMLVGWYAVIGLSALAWSLSLGHQPEPSRVVNATVLSSVVWLTFFLWRRSHPTLLMDVFRPLPLVMIGLWLISWVTFFKYRHHPPLAETHTLRLTLTTFAFGLLLKMLLHVRIDQYGFVLAMPATLLLTVILVGWIPSWLTKMGGYGGAFRAIGLALLLIIACVDFHTMKFWFRQINCPVGTGADAFMASPPRGPQVKALLHELALRTTAHDTLAVLPEGVMVNFLAKRVNPTPYISFTPFYFMLFGEDRMLSELQAHPPDYLALVDADTSEFGFQFLGRDYGRRMFSWIREQYREVTLIGNRPFGAQPFGILLLKRQLRDQRET